MRAPVGSAVPARSAAPPCGGLGPWCRALRVTLRVGSLEDGADSLDHEATWLLGHTQHISFGELWEDQGDLYADATLHVSCRFLRLGPSGAQCTAHGFAGPVPREPRRATQTRQLGGDRFVVIDRAHPAAQRLAGPQRSPTARALPVLSAPNGAAGEVAADNPCAGAPCRTADNKRGAACCRDLQVEIMCTRAQRKLEALVRTRRSPYLCKVERVGDFSIEAEMISACGYLGADGIACTLHGRRRADGRPAKPDLCSEWPPRGRVLHPGCVFARRRAKRPRAAEPRAAPVQAAGALPSP